MASRAAKERTASAATEEEEEEQIADLSNSDVVTKYRLAADIANNTLNGVLEQIKPGAKVVDICKFGDTLIERQCGQSFKSKKIEKGIAFPTSLSVNECVCHFSPLPDEDQELKAGDVVKVDLGAHIDGFIGVVAHTVVVSDKPAAEMEPLSGEQAKVFKAAHQAAELCARAVKPGEENHTITKMIERVAEAYGVTPTQATLSHQLKQFVIDGNKVFIQKEDPEQKLETYTFEQNEVYSVDICFSTGEGKPKEKEARTTIFKRAIDNNYRLKMKASRYVLNEVNKRFPTFPFTIRAFEDEKQARMGVVEMERSDMLHSYPVMFEKDGVTTAHFKFTILLLPSGTTKVTGLDLPPYVEADDQLPEDLQPLLKQSATKSRRRRNKNKNKK